MLAPDCEHYTKHRFGRHMYCFVCKLHPNCRNDCKDFKPREEKAALPEENGQKNILGGKLK